MKKAIISGNVDTQAGVIFVMAGQFYGEEVYTKYPHMFEQEVEEIKVVETIEVVEEIKQVEETPVVIETPIVHPHQHAHLVHLTPAVTPVIPETQDTEEIDSAE